MPPAATAPPVQNAPQPSHSKLTEEERSHLANMDAAVARMKKVSPPQPYYITVPQDDSQKYRHQYKAQAYQWTRDTPFDMAHDREWYQYQTFVFREPGKNLLALHSHEIAMPPTTEKLRPVTATNTPNQAPKKGMSLGAYKQRKQGGAAAGGNAAGEKEKEQTGKQPALKGPAEKGVSKESADMLAAVQAIEQEDVVAGGSKEKDTQQAAKATAEKQELKRKRGDSATAPEKQATANGHASSPPAKKARMTPPPKENAQAKKAPSPTPVPTKAAEPNTNATAPAHGPELNLPPKLSPLREKQSDSEKGFPRRLTPTLPDNIVASLDARKQDAAEKDSKLAPSTSQNGTKKHKSPAPRKGFRTQSNSPAADGQEERPVPRSTANGEHAKATESNQGQHDSSDVESNGSQVVKLKFKKGSHKEGIRRLLALPPRPEATSAVAAKCSGPAAETPRSASRISDRDAGRRTSGKGVAQKVGPAAKKTVDSEKRPVSEKRLRAEDEAATADSQEPAAKKKRVDKPSSATQAIEPAPKITQQSETGHEKAGTKAKGTAEHKPADASAKRKQQDEAGEQAPASEKTKVDGTQPSEPKPTEVPAKNRQANGSEQQEPAARKKKPDQARYEPPSKKRSIDGGASQSAAKGRPDSLELKKTPSTPGPRELQSPTVNSANKSQHITPGGRKDLLSATRHRDASIDSQTSTPSGLGNTPLTNNNQPSTSQPNGGPRAPSIQPSTRTPQQQAWETERERLEQLGRSIKHAASAALKAANPSNPTSSAQQAKLSACLAIESLLCFLAAYSCEDQAALAADPKRDPSTRPWRTMLPFFLFVQRLTKDFPVLSGLTASLGMVLHAHIIALGVMHSSSTSASASAGKNFHETNADLLRLANEAEVHLGFDELVETFPETWKARTKGVVREGKKLELKSVLAGQFKLPLGVATSPVLASRAGIAMLKEWIEKEGVAYEWKLQA